MVEKHAKKPYLTVNFDLSRNSDKCKITGLAEFFPEEILISENGEKRAVKAEKIKKYKCPRGVGCIMLEAETEEGEILLFRASMENAETVAEATKILNKALDTGEYVGGGEAIKGILCPKCHRPYPPGSKTCPRCADKGKYLIRLWKIAKPFRKYIGAPLFCYFRNKPFGALL